MAGLDLEEEVAVTVAADGTAEAVIGPVRGRQVWSVTSVQVAVSTNLSEAEATLYGPMGTVLSNTLSGSSGDTAGVAVTLRVGSRIRVVWTGADPGARATVGVYGTMEIGA